MNNKWLALFQKIHIHPVFWVIIGISIVTANFWELLLLFIIVFVHELGHSVAATFFSWRIKQILILPFGGVCETEEHGNRPMKEELIVTLAGPFQHILLAIGAFLLHHFQFLTTSTFELFMLMNVMIFIVNLLPIWPLDGGKLLFLTLSHKQPFIDAYEKVLRFSAIFLASFFVFYLFIDPYHLNVWVIATFLFYSLYHDWKHRHYVFVRFLVERYYGKSISFSKIEPIIVDEKEKIHHVLQRFQRGCKHNVIVMKGDKKQSPLDENEILYAYFTEKLTTIDIGDILYSY